MRLVFGFKVRAAIPLDFDFLCWSVLVFVFYERGDTQAYSGSMFLAYRQFT